MKLSVVITYFDKQDLIYRAIRSVTDQIRRKDEVIIVDDGSGDQHPVEAIQMLQSSRVTSRLIVLETNQGPGNAKNIGISSAGGEIIVLLDADDEMLAGSLVAIREAFEEYPEADFLFGDYIKHDESTGQHDIVSCQDISDVDGWLRPRALAKNWILLGSSPFRKSRIWDKYRYPSSEASTDDKDFWRSVLVGGAKGKYLSRTIYQWNIQPNGVNSHQNPRFRAQSWLRHRHFYKDHLSFMSYLWRLIKSTLLAIFYPDISSRKSTSRD